MKSKTNSMKSLHIVVMAMLFAFQPTLFSQTNKDKGTQKPEILESAMLRIIYTFSQQAMKEREPFIITDTMALCVGQRHSVYYDWNKQLRDSLNSAKNQDLFFKIKSVQVIKDAETLEQQLTNNHDKPDWVIDDSQGESSRIYKNRPQSEIKTVDDGPKNQTTRTSTYLEVTETIPPQEWQIAEDTTTVLGYMCNKATATFRGRSYIAWFTMDIPINDGPWKLYGLPGMILKAEDADGLFHFNAIGIEQLNDINIEMPTDRDKHKSTLKELKAFRKNRFKNVALNYFNGGNMLVLSKRNPVEYTDMEIED